MRDVQEILFNNVATDASINSAAIPIQQIYKMSAIVVAVDPNTNIDGSLQLQVSNDKAPAGNMAPFTPTNWANLGSPITIDDAGIDLVSATDMSYRWLRAAYTDNSVGASDGTISVIVEMQGF